MRPLSAAKLDPTDFITIGARLSAKERYTGRSLLRLYNRALNLRLLADKFENIITSNPILFVGNTVDPTSPLQKYASLISVL